MPLFFIKISFSISALLACNSLQQCFPNFFVHWYSKKAKKILLHNSHINLFKLITSSITGDSEKGDDLFSFFFGDPHFFAQHDTTSDVIDYCFMVAFTMFWLKTCINIKYLKTNRGAQFRKHWYMGISAACWHDV